jgi:hypothetical protein
MHLCFFPQISTFLIPFFFTHGLCILVLLQKRFDYRASLKLSFCMLCYPNHKASLCNIALSTNRTRVE